MNQEIEIPELRKNQIGITVKTFYDGLLKFQDETLYFTINKDSISMELYPNKPIIIIDRDAAIMILKKIAEI